MGSAVHSARHIACALGLVSELWPGGGLPQLGWGLFSEGRAVLGPGLGRSQGEGGGHRRGRGQGEDVATGASLQRKLSDAAGITF